MSSCGLDSLLGVGSGSSTDEEVGRCEWTCSIKIVAGDGPQGPRIHVTFDIAEDG